MAALLVVAAVAAAALLWRTRTPPVQRRAGLPVLLVSIDTLRADALGAYGNASADTPLLDRLAEDGVVFERARAHNVVTLPSHANMLSGRLPFGHGIRDNSGFRFPDELPTLATLLKERGYRTGAFVSAFVLDSRFGLGRGFDVYDDRLREGAERTEFLVPERPGPETVARAREWIEGADGPWFAFVHLYEPHFPYEPPPELARRFADEPYHGEVAAADRALAPLIEPLLAAADAAEALIVVTSDHGEALGEHGELTHGIFAYEATVRVPLILHAPGLLRPRRVAADVGSIDVAPTILDAVGAPVPPEVEGRSLLALAAGGGGDTGPTYLEALSSSLNRGWAPLHGLVHDDLKYIELPIPELYDLAEDPGEKRNLAPIRPKELEAMRSRLQRVRAGDTGVGERIEEEQAALERLQALGYVTGGSGAPGPKDEYTDDDDPKNLIEADTRIRRVVELYHAGRIEEARELCLENIRLHPEMPISYLHLAYLERSRGDILAAVEAAKQSLTLRPLDVESLALLATYLTEAGRAGEAVELTDGYAATAGNDLDVLTARGMALAAVGRFDDALATFARARQEDESNLTLLTNAGTVHLMRGDAAAARRAFETALAVDPDLPKAQNGLGVLAARDGRMEEAVERWRRAVELDPRDYQTLYNLGLTLRRLGRNDEARRYLQAYLEAAPVALEADDMAQVRAWLERGSG